MISFTRRITMGTVVLTMVVVACSIGVVWTAARWQAINNVDQELNHHAEHFQATAVKVSSFLGGDGTFDFMHAIPPWIKKSPPPLGTGKLLIQIVEEKNGLELFPPDPAANGLSKALKVFPAAAPVWVTMPDGRLLRGLWMTATKNTKSSVSGFFAIDVAPQIAEWNRLGVMLLFVWCVASALAILAAWWLRRSVIGPLERLAAAIHEVKADSPGVRINATVPQEMLLIVDRLNELLERQATLLSREKQTIANIAHELRSPISGLRTTLEVATLNPATTGPDLVSRCLPTVVTMHAMVINLLALARLEAGNEQVVLEPMDSSGLIDACWSSVEPLAQERHQWCERSYVTAQIRTCRDKAKMILCNLLDNAIAYAPSGSRIHLTSEITEGYMWIRISNVIEGPPPDLAHIFEPFWRGDNARTAHQHCGLGLVLTQRLAALIDARVHMEILGDRFVAHLGFPLVT